MTSKSYFILTTAMLVVSPLIIAITVPKQAEAAAKGEEYCVLGCGADDVTFYQCFQTKKECKEGLKIAEQNYPDFVFYRYSCSNILR
jgi:hypothetical protein